MIRAVTHQPFVVYSVNDPAIERETPEGLQSLAAYMLERDETKLAFLPGAQRTAFHCSPLRHGARLWVEQFAAESTRLVASFRACVTRIEGLEIDGVPWSPEWQQAGWSQTAQLLTDDCVAKLCDAGLGKEVEEIGLVCLLKATLTPEKKRAFRLPLGFVPLRPRISGAATAPTDGARSRRSTGPASDAAEDPTTSPKQAAATPAATARRG